MVALVTPGNRTTSFRDYQVNFGEIRVDGNVVCLGNGQLVIHNIGHRRRRMERNETIPISRVVRRVGAVGQLGVGSIEAYRCPSSPV